jgi:hypothetical protein
VKSVKKNENAIEGRKERKKKKNKRKERGVDKNK